MHSNIGRKIKAARKSKGLTQRMLAEKIKKTFSTVQKYENGVVEPPLSVIVDIAAALDMTPPQLMGFDVPLFADDTIEATLLTAFDQLNDEGQQKAVERVEELTEIPKYQQNGV